MVAYLAFISVLVSFGIDTVLPAFDDITGTFGLEQGAGSVSLVITVYFLGISAGQLIYGPLSDHFGRVPVLLASLVVYGIGALGSTVAPSMTVLLVARTVWGLGAAGNIVIYTAMARDLYEGDTMARVMQFVLAAFLLGPMVSPAIGEALLLTGWWRSVFGAAVVLALAATVWTLRIGETLAPADRRPLDLGSIGRGFRAVMGRRDTVGYMVALTFSSGAFYVFLGSGEPIINNVFGQGRWFAAIFALMSAGTGLTLVGAARVTPRLGARRVTWLAAVGYWATGVAGAVMGAAAGGVPPLWAWILLTTISLSCMTVMTPTCISLAVTPLGHLAGTASAVVGFVTQGGGALLAAVVDAQIDDSVTPMAVGAACYGVVSILAVWWAGGQARSDTAPAVTC